MRVASLDKPVLLVGREAMNRSVDGDVVVVEILPKSQWRAPATEVVDQDRECRFAMVFDCVCRGGCSFEIID